MVVRGFGDSEVIEIALVENLQREDLSALEEAEAYSRLMREFGRSQASLAEAVGKSRSHVANTVRLLSLPAPVRSSLEEGALSAGHARALLGAPDPVGLGRRGRAARPQCAGDRKAGAPAPVNARAAAEIAARRRHARARTRTRGGARSAGHARAEIARRQPDAALYEPRPARPDSGPVAPGMNVGAKSVRTRPAPEARKGTFRRGHPPRLPSGERGGLCASHPVAGLPFGSDLSRNRGSSDVPGFVQRVGRSRVCPQAVAVSGGSRRCGNRRPSKPVPGATCGETTSRRARLVRLRAAIRAGGPLARSPRGGQARSNRRLCRADRRSSAPRRRGANGRSSRRSRRS